METMEEMYAREAREQQENPISWYIKELRSYAIQARKQAEGYDRKADLIEAQYKALTVDE